MVAIRRLYSIYCIAIFGVLFLLLLPFFLIFIQRKSWHSSGVWLNHIWSQAFCILCLVPVKREFHFKIDKSRNYIFCANHFSYFDIALMSLIPIPFAFVGKVSMSRIPVFGYMYRKLHILVDRNNSRSRYDTFQRSVETLEEGLSLTIFPEGGIKSKNLPKMSSFKTGAFRTAILTNTPIVPVTIPYNWLFLPDDGKFLPSPRRLKMVFHEPIDPSEYTIETLNELNSRVFDIIAEELDRLNSNEGH